ncbi:MULTISPECIES: undecaprenyldiphospho-muramoylpentapeptide beta-N-acetylglucosaminyltransferase [Shewanella]|uniref:UDP-N-acetylglucosamine--N-acetylmuramyl-(pentapeptide) pyrophosphoryl-undecaprenol N-acetylglucosamine transferase n=1 Tax=Shewanella xiamenensis TaxID=332186 RepID=A0AAE4Q335_9GAMM|nr:MULTISPECIES: undecaprenyldiphospho-muramoylpentapeptide beta-N-acetylglucosaminyltransferase [Shewanella]MDV5391804.1 undecaprenyldiphospho-muramoylpentapeptide beta-N-acetylglucosaminyltransferase [Shewanella xiamenensis]PWH01864.1 undecaprenyldiphospho-muramoylpentapeptide beta-N-acetylglucosaminyltransferase [Shewanella xiamenensis]BDQ64636.1 UDP-N-acetylglucosamine--N-acetylmuramyl-(pentapeptide) pyrophosphoryl-undecaprenol N-acetylglucosamine transferase [Shewanella xiamenensis]GLD7845
MTDAGKRILVMAGGTGGHVFPALAVAKYLAQQGWQVRWLGTADRMEVRLVPQYGFDIDFIDIQGVRGNGLVRKLAAPFKVVRSILQAKAVIAEFKPDVVLGMGGFASGPGGVAAKLAGVPLVLHEQNAIPGMTNKLLSRIASQVLCAFKNTFTQVKAKVVGNPIRRELIALGAEPKQAADDALKVLVVGGSLGAKVFNDLMPEVVAALSKQQSITVWHQVGKDNLAGVKSAYQQQGQEGGVNVAEFIDDMEAAYRWADVVLCRAGALTVSELAAVGLPSILVPYPHAVDDHQTRNAQVLVEAGAAFLLPQAILDVNKLVSKLQLLANDRAELAQMGQRARDVAVLDATEQVAQVCIALAEKG